MRQSIIKKLFACLQQMVYVKVWVWYDTLIYLPVFNDPVVIATFSTIANNQYAVISQVGETLRSIEYSWKKRNICT